MPKDVGNGIEYMEHEGELVDLSSRSHVQCRLRSGGGPGNQTQQQVRPVFLIITPQVMSIAEVVVPDRDDEAAAMRLGSEQNDVRNTSVVPIHLVEAIVDSSNPRTLHLTVFSQDKPKLFSMQQYGNTSSPAKSGTLALSCWRLTVGFANAAACAWTKATVEKHRAALRRDKLGRYCRLLGVGDLNRDTAL